jgi:hypothetical protein
VTHNLEFLDGVSKFAVLLGKGHNGASTSAWWEHGLARAAGVGSVTVKEDVRLRQAVSTLTVGVRTAGLFTRTCSVGVLKAAALSAVRVRVKGFEKVPALLLSLASLVGLGGSCRRQVAAAGGLRIGAGRVSFGFGVGGVVGISARNLGSIRSVARANSDEFARGFHLRHVVVLLQQGEVLAKHLVKELVEAVAQFGHCAIKDLVDMVGFKAGGLGDALVEGTEALQRSEALVCVKRLRVLSVCLQQQDTFVRGELRS